MTMSSRGDEPVADVDVTTTPCTSDTTHLLPRLVELADRFGNKFYVGNAGDYWHPPFPIGADHDYRTHVRQIRDMEIRDDDIMICSYPKTGGHWQQEIIHMLVYKTTRMCSEGEKAFCFIDFSPVSTFADVSSPRLLVTHVPFRYLPREAFQKKIKIIYLERNPKDVLVSYYNQLHSHVPPLHYPGTFEHFFRLNLEVGFVYGDLFDYLMEWQNGREAHPDLQICTSVYEDMKLDPVGGVKRFNAYLCTGCSDELCEEIAAACSFDRMKSHKDATTPAWLKAMFREKKLEFYRKGEVGDWKNWFSVAMNEEFDAEYKKRMSEYKTIYKYTL